MNRAPQGAVSGHNLSKTKCQPKIPSPIGISFGASWARAKEGIADPDRRQGRGFTFAYLATTLALVSMNLRKIHTFIRDLLNTHLRKVKIRASRRTDNLILAFNRAGHHSPPASVQPTPYFLIAPRIPHSIRLPK
ncbi:hypothetical protein [Homoserinimonas sp. OAct 916]|uniref:hypothetical protein n=1 Tax=Homoserinimonas sp. OAct 916 TaxID=2211450 RepID=UPI000DBE1652|nr:hypothetical protein [Homoserinimonas sp. OAct 916]